LANHISNERDYHDEFGQNTEDLLMSGREEGNPIVEELEQHIADSSDVNKSEQEVDDDGLAADLTGTLQPFYKSIFIAGQTLNLFLIQVDS
jgi:hypothetical protein